MINFKVGPTLLQFITIIFADSTFFQLGIHLAWLSPLLIQLKDANQTVLPQTITDYQAAWLISSSNLVGVFTFLFNIGYLADGLGRKYTIILSYVPRLINCLMCLIATDLWMLMLGRAVGGISDVICCCVSSAYASEIASKENRGSIGTVAQIMSSLGSMIILSVGPFLDYMTLTIIISCITVVTFVPLLFLPESPYLLYAKGRVTESTAILTLLRNKDAIDEELTEYSININMNAKISKLALLKDYVVMKTILKVIVLAIGTQTTGYNAVIFYLQSVFESTHTSLRPEIASAIIGCIQILAGCVTITVTDKFGRKPILICSSVGLAIGMTGLGTFFRLRDEHYEITGFLNYLPLASLIVVIFSFNAGMGATVWSLCAELFDGPSRAMGVSIGVFVATVFTFLLTRYFGVMTTELGPAATYWLFGGCCVVTCIFIIFCIPETKGKAFSEIQRDMGRKNAALERSESIVNQSTSQ